MKETKVALVEISMRKSVPRLNQRGETGNWKILKFLTNIGAISCLEMSFGHYPRPPVTSEPSNRLLVGLVSLTDSEGQSVSR